MDESDDDDVGPMPAPAGADPSVKPKRRKGELHCDRLKPDVYSVLKHERLYLERLPAADRYFRSFMHRDVLADVTVTAYVEWPIRRSQSQNGLRAHRVRRRRAQILEEEGAQGRRTRHRVRQNR